MTEETIGGTGAAQQVHPELYALTKRIAELYKLKNGKTALYWSLVATINSHTQPESYKKLGKIKRK